MDVNRCTLTERRLSQWTGVKKRKRLKKC
jgi:hypothetical protein